MPNLVSAAIADATPTQIQVTYDAALDAGSVSAIGRFWTIDTHRCTTVAIAGSVVTLTFLHAFYFGETVSLYYSVPATNPIRGAGAGALVAAITGAAVTNNIVSTGNSYFVDPQTGIDTNNGTSQLTPWKTIPGTRQTGNGAFLNGAWGAISAANKLSAGDQIFLKAGSTMTSAAGGKLQVDGNYYNNGTPGHPIIIRVSNTWGTGNFLYNGAGMTVPADNGLVGVFNLAYIHIQGASSSKLFEVSNAVNQAGILFKGASSVSRSAGYSIDYADVHDCNYIGLDNYYTDRFAIRRLHSHNNGPTGLGLGVSLGGVNDALCTNVTMDGGITNNNGTSGSSGIRHGVGIYACTGVLVTGWESYGNGRDGYDIGTVSNSGTCNGVMVNSKSHGNFEDGVGLNGGPGANVQWWIVNSILFNCSNGTQMYEGCIGHYWHCIFHANNDPNFGGSVLTYSGAVVSPVTQLEFKNNIFYKVAANAFHVGGYTGNVPTIDSNNNLWIPRSSDAEVLTQWPYGGTIYTYTGASPSWWGAAEKRGIAQDPGFVSAASTTNINLNDYHLSAVTSTAVAAGTYLSSIAEVLFDRDGIERPNPPAIGAYEFGVTPPPPPPPPPTPPVTVYDGINMIFP